MTAVETTPWARDDMSPADRAEITETLPPGAHGALSATRPTRRWNYHTYPGNYRARVWRDDRHGFGEGPSVIAAWRAALADLAAQEAAV